MSSGETSDYVAWVSIWRGSDTRNVHIFLDLSAARWRIVCINFRFSHKRILDGCTWDVHRRNVDFMGVGVPLGIPGRTLSHPKIRTYSFLYGHLATLSCDLWNIDSLALVGRGGDGQKGARGFRIRSAHASLFAPHPPMCRRAIYVWACTRVFMYTYAWTC